MAAGFVGKKRPKTHVAPAEFVSTLRRKRFGTSSTISILIRRDDRARAEPSAVPTSMACLVGTKSVSGIAGYISASSSANRLPFSSPKSSATPLEGYLDLRTRREDGDGTLLTITERENTHNPLLQFFDRFVICYSSAITVSWTSISSPWR